MPGQHDKAASKRLAQIVYGLCLHEGLVTSKHLIHVSKEFTQARLHDCLVTSKHMVQVNKEFKQVTLHVMLLEFEGSLYLTCIRITWTSPTAYEDSFLLKSQIIYSSTLAESQWKGQR